MRKHDILAITALVRIGCETYPDDMCEVFKEALENIKNCVDCQHTFKQKVEEDTSPLEGQVSMYE